MSDAMETIRRSMAQTDECQRMCREAMDMCQILIGRCKVLENQVVSLQAENDRLKKRKP